MGHIVKLALPIMCLTAMAIAIPVSLLEDIKDAQMQSPVRTNKVKRAQEVLMFGNQQNRAINNYGNQRPEKRDVGDNTLEDVATLPNILPQVDEEGYDTNQLGAGANYEKAYPYIGREPNYGLLLRNAALKESLHNEPVLGYGDLPLYSMMDARRKRDTSHKNMPPSTTKNSFRSKRDYDLSPEEIVSLMRILQSERRPNNNRYHESRGGWPMYGTDGSDDFDIADNQEDNTIDTEGDYNRNGVWLDGPVNMGQPAREPADFWPRKYKRFMVSKRRSDGDILSQLNSPYDFPEGVPLQRRFIL